MLLVTVLSFGQVFDRGDYPGPVLLGVVIASTIAILARRFGIGTGPTLLASVIGLLLYLTLVFQARNSFYGLPTLGVLEGLGRAIANAYDNGRVDYAPVPVRTGYVILTAIGMWFAATLGEVATFRWRRPLLASLPAMGMFSLVMVVGTGTASGMFVILFLTALLMYWALESAHRLRSWGRWVPTWPDRPEDDASPIAASLARRMGVTCVVAALAAPLFLPALGDSLLSWRIDAGAGGLGDGGGPGGRVDPFVSMKPRLLEQTELELFKVRSDKPAYWKLVTLSRFDGERWYPDSTTTTSVPAQGGLVTQDQLPSSELARRVTQQYELTGLRGEFLPAAVVPAFVTFADETAGVRSDLGTGDISLTDEIEGPMEYEVVSVVPNASFQELRATEVVLEDEDAISDEYYALPSDLSPEIESIAERWAGNRETDTDKLIAIQARLRAFTYDLAVEAGASDDYLLQFLTETRRGFCQQFATAFAVLARSLGYPARVAVGFLPGETSPENPNLYTARGTDAHAWPEVYYGRDYGWVAFEPTPRSEAAPPRYTTPPRPGGAGGGFGLDPNAQIRALNRQPDGQGFLPPADGSSDRFGVNQPRGPKPEPVWKDAFATLAGIMAILAVGALFLIPLLKVWVVRRRYLRARDPGELAAAAFAEFQAEAGELVDGRRSSESAVAYALRIASMRDVSRSAAERLAKIYEASQYAPWQVPREDEAEARRLARVLRNSLWGAATWWERLMRLFAPRLMRLSPLR